MSDVKRGTHGRPSGDATDGVPLGVSMLAMRLHEEADTDWLMTAGWLVMRCWETPTEYRIVYARVAHETGTYEVDR
jgi:hypothetical protein